MDNQSFDIHFQPNRRLFYIKNFITYTSILRYKNNKEWKRLTKSQIDNDIFFTEMAGHVAISVWEVSRRKALQDGIKSEYYLKDEI